MKHLVIGSALLASSTASVADQAAIAPATQTVVQPQATAVIESPAQLNILRSGTEVPLLTREELTTKKKKLRVGQRFQMEVAADIEGNGVVVIPKGSPAVGEITEVRNKGMWGKSGYINARAVSVRVGDRSIRLTGTFDDKGVTGTGGVVASIALVPLAGFFTTGTSAMIASGSGVKAFLDEDIAYRAVPVQPKVLEVPVSAAAITQPTQPQAPSTAAPARPAGK